MNSSGCARRSFLFGRAAAAAAAILACVWLPCAYAQPAIKVGVLVASTGPLAFVGDPEAKTVKLLVDQINRAGGVLGRPVEAVVYDTGADARQATTLARRLIENDKVDFMIGPSSSGETMAVVPIIEEAGLPLISMAAANAIIEPVKKWVFKTPHSYQQAIEKIFSDMRERGIKTVGIIAGAGGADQDCRNEAHKSAAAYGLRIAADETHAPADTDMTPQLTRIRGSGAAAILGCNTGSTSVITTRNYRQMGLKVPLYFQHGAGSQQFIDQTAGAAEGVRVPVPAVLVASQLAADDPQLEIASRYAKAFKAATGEAVSAFGAYAHDALLLGLDAVRRAGSADKAKVREQLEKTSDFIGATGIYKMTAKDHMGLDQRSFKMAEIRNGAFVLVK